MYVISGKKRESSPFRHIVKSLMHPYSVRSGYIRFPTVTNHQGFAQFGLSGRHHAKIHTWIRLFPYKRSLQSIEPSSFTLLGWFRLSSIDQYSSLLPPVGVWTVSQFQCGGPSSQNPYPSKTRWAVTPPTI